MTWFTWTYTELFANAMTALCIFLAGRNNVHTWWTGIVACIAFMFVFYDVKLYADVALQIFFVVTGFIGWLNWQANKKLGISSDQTPIKSLMNDNKYALMWAFFTAVIVAMAYSKMLQIYTDAFAPALDSTVLAFSVLGQVLLMKRYKENWIAWFIVNSIAVPLFWSRELYLTSILYGFFWVNSIVSYLYWNKLYDAQKS